MRLYESTYHHPDTQRESLTPRETVSRLDNYIVGQNDAKRAVAIALRNRWRRRQLSEELQQEVMPKNIIMIGPTGVGKTEIARRLAELADAPFIKVEASKYTEVGYYGRDVESMIRELTELSANMVRKEKMEEVRPQAEENADERIIDRLYTPRGEMDRDEEREESHERTRDRLRRMLKDGKLEDRKVEIEVSEKPSVSQGMAMGGQEMGIDMQELMEQMLPSQSETRRMSVAEAREVLTHQEAEKLIDKQQVQREAVARAESNGIIFIDELDKVAGQGSERGPDVSRQGVQRDLLPIVEGSTVNTRYGMVGTDHILFIAAGAFNVSKPSDLVPELQGRFPIRVELDELSRDDFARILREPRNALTRQYRELMKTEGLEVEFTDDAVERLADMAEQINKSAQSIGARRLHTVMEKLMEDVSFDAPNMDGQEVSIDADYVDEKLEELASDEDLTRYIL